MRWTLSFVLAVVALGGCTEVETVAVLPDEYEIGASPPAGMYGGWAALSPSYDAFTEEASARCPSGYKMVNQEIGRGPFATIDFIRWDILCLPPQADRAQP